MTIIDALQDPAFFGSLSTFQDLVTWKTWTVFLKALYGLPLTSREVTVFCTHTGRRTHDPPPGGWDEIVLIVGRQAGKTRITGLIADFEAATADPPADRTDTYVLLVSQDHRGAMRTLFSYVKAPFETVPMLASMVTNQTADTIRLSNNISIAAYPCRPASIRGLRAQVVILDELAFFQSSENLPMDVEMLRAVRPCLATTGGKLIILSSPYAESGALYDLHKKHYGHDDSPTLVWQASAPDMNPTLSRGYLSRMEQDDPEAYASEVLGQFRAGLSNLLDPAAIQACVDDGVRERPPQPNVWYEGFCDPSGGRRDAFTLAIGHRDGDMGILDCVRSWAPPFDPSSAIAEASEVLRAYRVSQVVGDRYAAEFVVSAFRSHGITYRASEKDRSAIYLDLLPLVNAQRVRLLDV